MAIVHFDQRFRAGSNNVEVTPLRIGQRHEIHVWAGVERTKHAVHVEWIGWRINVKTLGNDHLEHVTIDDVLLGDFNGTLIIALLRTETKLGLANGLIQHIDASFTFDRRGGLTLHIIQSRHRLVVCRIGTGGSIVYVHRIGDHPYRSGHMVDHSNIRGQCQNCFRLPGLVRRLGTQGRFPMANRIPTDGTDQTTGQVRQSFDMRRFQCFQRSMRDFHHIAFGRHACGNLTQPIGLAVVGTQLSHGIHTDEAVSVPRAAKFRGFKNECAGTSCSKAFIESDRSQRISQKSAHNRNHTISLISQFVELFATRPGGAPLECLYAAFTHRWPSCSLVRYPTTTGSCPPSSKQDRLPVWQAAPT